MRQKLWLSSYLTRSLVGKALEKSCKWLLLYYLILKAGFQQTKFCVFRRCSLGPLRCSLAQRSAYSSSNNLAPPISRVLIGQHLIFSLLTPPTCCNSPPKCTPVKYKAKQKAGFPIVTYTTSAKVQILACWKVNYGLISLFCIHYDAVSTIWNNRLSSRNCQFVLTPCTLRLAETFWLVKTFVLGCLNFN